MTEITAAELRRLQQLEGRIASTQDTLAEVRAKRDEARAEATALRGTIRTLTRDNERSVKQVEQLIAENARLAETTRLQAEDAQLATKRAEELTAQNTKLSSSVTEQAAALKKATTSLRSTVKDRDTLAKQLQITTEKLDDGDVAEVTPEQLSSLLASFVSNVGATTGLENVGTKLNLKVGFSGRGGGSFVVPSVGSDPDKFPELHELSLDLAPASRASAELESSGR